MKIIRRYVLSEYISATLFGLVVFTFILLLEQIFLFVNVIITKGVGVYDALTLFLLMLPNIFSLSIPISTLFGGILSYGRLTSDNEITAMKTAGIGCFSFALPPIAFNFLLSGSLVLYNLHASPQTYKKFNEYYYEVVQKKPTLKIEEKSIITIGSSRIYFEGKDKGGRLKNVSIYQFNDAEGLMVPSLLISASSATISVHNSHILFRMYSGSIQKTDIRRPSEIASLQFVRYDIPIAINHSVQQTKSLREYTASELLCEIERYKNQSLPYGIFETEYNLRIAVGVAPFFFSLIGIPLGLLAHRGSKAIGFALSTGVIFCYYIFLAVGINFSDKGYLASAFSLQIPNMAAAFFASLLWRKITR